MNSYLRAFFILMSAAIFFLVVLAGARIRDLQAELREYAKKEGGR